MAAVVAAMKVDALAALVRQSPTVALVLLLWWEVHQMQVDLSSLTASMAVLVDREHLARTR